MTKCPGCPARGPDVRLINGRLWLDVALSFFTTSYTLNDLSVLHSFRVLPFDSINLSIRQQGMIIGTAQGAPLHRCLYSSVLLSGVWHYRKTSRLTEIAALSNDLHLLFLFATRPTNLFLLLLEIS